MADQDETPKISLKQRLINFKNCITVEPVVAAWIIPACILIIATENLNLEKGCRVNLNLDSEICANMLNKSISNIVCSESESLVTESLGNGTGEMAANFSVSDDKLSLLHKAVCTAEEQTQSLLAIAYGIRGPISAIFPLIIILFAGGWSDKRGLRKPCMLLPLIGELIACIFLLLSAMIDWIPMDVPVYTEKIIPSLFGGQTLMLMGIYSYLTGVTTEENRTFRFGCFTIFFTLIPITFLPWSGTLYNLLGYQYLFILSIVVYLLGIFYIVFILKEVKVTKQEAVTNGHSVNGKDNPAFTSDTDTNISNSSYPTNSMQVAEDPAPKKNICAEFFDLALTIDMFKVFLKKRENNKKLVLYLLICCYFTFYASLGENDFIYLYTRLKLNWEGEQYSLHLTYSTVMALIGTLIIVGIFSKIFHMSDALIGIISTICTLICRPIYAFSTTTAMYYIGTTIDLFISTKAIAIKSLISKCVPEDELARMYSILGIIDSIDSFIFPALYSIVYSKTVSTFPGAIFLFSEFFFVLTLIMFVTIYIFVQGKKFQSGIVAEVEKDNAMQSTKM